MAFACIYVAKAQSAYLDSTFGISGIVLTPVAGVKKTCNPNINSIAMQNDGKIVAIGNSNSSAPDQMFVIRYNSDGSIDPGFNGTGMYIRKSMYGEDIAVQSDGKILISGYSDSLFIVRFNTDGSIDTSFNKTGMIKDALEIGSINDARLIKILPDGKILAVINNLTDEKIGLARYTSNGKKDTTYGKSGVSYISLNNYYYSSYIMPRKIILQTFDSSIVIIGDHFIMFDPDEGGNVGLMVRINKDGKPDSAFNKNVPYFSTEHNTGVLLPDRKILVIGNLLTIKLPAREVLFISIMN